jgi:hypothetical protein
MGLNFVTLRARREIVDDYLHVVRRIYSARPYFRRCLKLAFDLRPNRLHRPSVPEALRMLIAFARLALRLGLVPPVAVYFWRNILLVLATRPSCLEPMVNLMGMYIHFRRQSSHIARAVQRVVAPEDPEGLSIAGY